MKELGLGFILLFFSGGSAVDATVWNKGICFMGLCREYVPLFPVHNQPMYPIKRLWYMPFWYLCLLRKVQATLEALTIEGFGVKEVPDALLICRI